MLLKKLTILFDGIGRNRIITATEIEVMSSELMSLNNIALSVPYPPTAKGSITLQFIFDSKNFMIGCSWMR